MSAQLVPSPEPWWRICSGPLFQLMAAANVLGISWLRKPLYSDLCPPRHKAAHPLSACPHLETLSERFCLWLSSICLFILAAPGLPGCAPAFSRCGEWGLLSGCCSDFSWRWLLLFRTTGCRCTPAHGALEHRPRSYGTRLSLPQGVWHLPEPVIEPMSLALTDAFLTTELPGNPCLLFIYLFIYLWLGLRCRAQAFSSCGEWGPLFAAVSAGFSSQSWLLSSKLTGAVAVEHGLSRSLARGIFPEQGSKPCPLHWQVAS